MILNGKAPYQNIKEPSPNSKVWRYIDFAKFLHLITYSKLFFVRMDKLSDRLEGTLTENGIKEIEDRYNSLDFPISQSVKKFRTEKEINDIENFKKYTLVNCWTQNSSESFALWKIYLGNQTCGVSIQTKYKNLKRCLKDNSYNYLFQKIYYSDKVINNKMSSVQFRKNKYYRYESEVRIAIFSQYKKFGGEPKFENGAYINVDINQLIDNIYVSPFAPDWFYELITHLVKDKFNYEIPIIKSKIKEK